MKIDRGRGGEGVRWDGMRRKLLKEKVITHISYQSMASAWLFAVVLHRFFMSFECLSFFYFFLEYFVKCFQF